MPSSDPESTTPGPTSALRGLQFRVALGLVAIPVAFVAYQMFFAPNISFLYGGADDAVWITAPRKASAVIFVVDPTRPSPVSFEASFALAQAPPPSAVLHVRTPDSARVWLNSVEVADAEFSQTGARMSRVADIAKHLLVGTNELRVEVSSRVGPPLLKLWVDGLEQRVATDPDWTVSRPEEESPQPVVVADDTLPSEQSRQVSTPWEVLSRRAGIVALLFACSSGVFLLGRAIPESAQRRIPLLIAAALTLAWAMLFVVKTIPTPIEFGFDVLGHLEYIDSILERGELPRPGRGWSTSHPPLFYAISATFDKLGSVLAGESNRAVTLRILPLLSGLGILWLALPFADRVFRGDPLRVALTVLAAGLMPMNVYMSTFVSNEPLHAAFATAALWLTFVALDDPHARVQTLAALSVVLGLGLLSKTTSLLVFGLAGSFLAWKVVVVEGRKPAKVLSSAALFLVGPVVIAGWYYAANLVEFGTPVVSNWALIEDRTWWQHPGFHTPAYFLSFGESLRHPYYSSYRSFWDGLYSTLWGDGLVSGRALITSQRLQLWNPDFMALCFPLALPATALMFVGFGRATAASGRALRASRQLALLFLLAVVCYTACALVYMSLQLPAYGSAKMGFALFLVVPIALAIAEGFAALDRSLSRPKLLILRALLYGWLGSFFAVSLLAYWG